MTSRAAALFIAAIVVVAAGAGLIVYLVYFGSPSGAIASENWAGYEDQNSVGSASGTIAIPPASDWQGDGVASLWVGMGGSVLNGAVQWPFWQAGVQVSCTAGSCSAEMFDEGGTQGPPCNGVCPVDWTQAVGVAPGDSVAISVSGGSSGAIAVLTVDEDGFNSTYHPPAWTPLAGVTSFPSAEWIFESPQGASGTDVMPILTAPGVGYSEMADSSQLSDLGVIQMQGNPNGQSVDLSAYGQASFSAYSYDT